MAKSEITKIFSERLEELTEKKRDNNYKLSDKQQAEQMGIPYPTFTKYKNNNAECPISTIVKIAKYYNVSTDYLLGLQREPTNDTNVISITEYTGLSKEAVKIICNANQGGNNPNILFEYNGFEDIVKLLNIIKTLTVIKRYYNQCVVPNIESNDILDNLFIDNNFNSHTKLSGYIKYAVMRFIESRLNPINLSIVETPGSYNNLYDEKLVLTEYQLTELIFRTLINNIKNDTSKDKELFKEFDSQIGENLNELLINIKSNLADAHNHYEKCKLDEKEKEMKAEIEILEKYICYYNEKYKRKD